MADPNRVQFDANTPVKVTFAFDGGKEFVSSWSGKVETLYTFTDGTHIYAPKELAVKINYADPKKGETLWITKRQETIPTHRNGRSGFRRMTSWEVSRKDPGPGKPEIADQLEESREIAEKAKRGAQAKDNVARMPEPPEPPRKPPVVETHSTPPEPPTRARTQLEAALVTAVDACHRATEYARTLGYPVVFTSADIEKMAVTLLIEKQDQQKRRSA